MVSVIVPIYNAAENLQYCVKSVINQTCSDFELILVDDGSPDESGQICDEFAQNDSRIKVIHKVNGGVSSARNAGIDLASGEFIAFCDSDDYLEPDYLECLLKAKEQNPEYGHIWCCFQTVMGYAQENRTPNFESNEIIELFPLSKYMTLHERWLDNGPWNKLFQSEVIKANHLYFPTDISLGEDWLFNMAYIDASGNEQIAVITKPLYNYYRGNNESLDQKYRPDLLDIYKRLSTECLRYLNKWHEPQSEIEKFYNSRFFMYEKVLQNTMRAPEMSETEKIRWNTQFMQSEIFKEALSTRTCFIHPLYLKAYQTGNYYNVILIDRLHKIKSTFGRKRSDV